MCPLRGRAQERIKKRSNTGIRRANSVEKEKRPTKHNDILGFFGVSRAVSCVVRMSQRRVCRRVVQYICGAVCCDVYVLQWVAVCCSVACDVRMSQRRVCCRVVQCMCVAVCCNVLQCGLRCKKYHREEHLRGHQRIIVITVVCTATHWDSLQHTCIEPFCNTLQHTYIAQLCTNTLLCDIRTLQLTVREMQIFFWSTYVYNQKRSDLICRSKFWFLKILGFRSLGACSSWPEGICRHSSCSFVLLVSTLVPAQRGKDIILREKTYFLRQTELQ